jgi:hypothetical protein
LKNKTIRTIVQLLITLGVVGAFGYYLYVNFDKYLELVKISGTGVILLFLLSLAFPILNSIQNTYLYRGLGISNFSHLDGFLITSASTLANQLPIPGGIISKGYYLKRVHKLSYTKFTSSTFAIYFCFLAVNGLMGIGALVFWAFESSQAIPLTLLAAFVGMFASLLVFWLPLEKIKMPQKIHNLYIQAVEGWMMIGRNPGLLFRLTVLQIMLVLLLSVRYMIAFGMLSQKITLSQALLFSCASILTQLVSIVPGGLGVREAIVALVATVLGFDTGVSVVAVGLDRLVVTVSIVLTGWISTIYLGKQLAGFLPDTSSKDIQPDEITSD